MHNSVFDMRIDLLILRRASPWETDGVHNSEYPMGNPRRETPPASPEEH